MNISELTRTKTSAHIAPIPYATPTAPRSHAAEPIRNVEDIWMIRSHMISTGQYRLHLIFVIGIYFGLRAGDILNLKIGDFIKWDGSYKAETYVKEQKTGKMRKLIINEDVMDTLEQYLLNQYKDVDIDINDYLFTSQSHNNTQGYYEVMKTKGLNTKGENKPIRVDSLERLLKKVVNDECGIDVHASTHMLRKTFAYHYLKTSPDRSKALVELMKILNHSSTSTTLDYSGITDDDIAETYSKMYTSSGFKFDNHNSIETA